MLTMPRWPFLSWFYNLAGPKENSSTRPMTRRRHSLRRASHTHWTGTTRFRSAPMKRAALKLSSAHARNPKNLHNYIAVAARPTSSRRPPPAQSTPRAKGHSARAAYRPGQRLIHSAVSRRARSRDRNTFRRQIAIPAPAREEILGARPPRAGDNGAPALAGRPRARTHSRRARVDEALEPPPECRLSDRGGGGTAGPM